VSPGETHKGRGQWSRWSGTPALVAEIAQEAHRLVALDDPGPAEIRIKLDAAAWESELIDPGTVPASLDPADVADLESVEIDARAAGRRIALSIKKPPRPSRSESSSDQVPVVELHVAGPERGWVLHATEAMKEAVVPGVPRGQRASRLALWASLALVALAFVLGVISGDEKDGLSTAERLGLVTAIAGGALFLLILLMDSLLPRFEIIPDGAQTKRMALLRWANREGGWLLRGLLLALAGSLVTLLIQRLT
jgi:hypothetical protein